MGLATLLGNRILDVWMHGQDIRRAVDRPGAMDTAAAHHTCAVFARAFLYSVGKRVAPPDGTTVLLDVEGEPPIRVTATMRDGRAVPGEQELDPTVRLSMGRDAFVMLAGGRRPPDRIGVGVSGDRDLAARVLAAMAVTP